MWNLFAGNAEENQTEGTVKAHFQLRVRFFIDDFLNYRRTLNPNRTKQELDEYELDHELQDELKDLLEGPKINTGTGFGYGDDWICRSGG